MITNQSQLVCRNEYDFQDFLSLLVGAEDLLGVLVVTGFFATRKNILCQFQYVDGLGRLWYFDYVAQKRKFVALERIQSFGVLCDVPPLDENDGDEDIGPINSRN